MGAITRLGVVASLALLLLIGWSGVVLADDCSGPDDCQAPPGNADAATGIAAGMAVLAIVLATAGRRRQQGGSRTEKREGRSTPDAQAPRAGSYDVRAPAEGGLGGSQAWHERGPRPAEVPAERWARMHDAAVGQPSQRPDVAPPGTTAQPGSAGGQLGGQAGGGPGHGSAGVHDLQRLGTQPPQGGSPPAQSGSDGGQLGGHAGGGLGHGGTGDEGMQRLGSSPPPAGSPPAQSGSDGGQLGGHAGGGLGHGGSGGQEMQRLGAPPSPTSGPPIQSGSDGGQLGGGHGGSGLGHSDHGSAPGQPSGGHDVAGGWPRERIEPPAHPEHHLTPEHDPQGVEKREGTSGPPAEPPRQLDAAGGDPGSRHGQPPTEPPPSERPTESGSLGGHAGGAHSGGRGHPDADVPMSERPTESGSLGGHSGGGHGQEDADFPISERPTDPRGQPGLGPDQGLRRPPRPYEDLPRPPDERA